MSSIRLDPERGVNPCVMRCEWCGEGHSVGLLGIGGYKAKCQKCDKTNVGNKNQHTCADPNCKGMLGESERMGESESIVSGLCDKCLENQSQQAKMVKEGGVYWKCSKCNCEGSLRGEHAISMAVRTSSGINAPDPVGFDFNGEGCPGCNPLPEVEETIQ